MDAGAREIGAWMRRSRKERDCCACRKMGVKCNGFVNVK
jgi:hypothetical protein